MAEFTVISRPGQAPTEPSFRVISRPGDAADAPEEPIFTVISRPGEDPEPDPFQPPSPESAPEISGDFPEIPTNTPESVRPAPVYPDNPTGAGVAGTTASGAFVEYITDPGVFGQNVREFGKGLVPGAVRFVGTALKGAASIAGKAAGFDEFVAELERADYYTPEQMADFRARMAQYEYPIYGMALDRFEEAQTPEERAAVVDRVKGLYVDRPVIERPVYKAGEAVTEAAGHIFPAEPGYKESVGRQLGEGTGSLVAGVAATALTGPLGAGAFFSFAGSGEAVERAVAEGATDEQIIESARLGLFPGMTDSVPIETLFGRIPIPGGKLLQKIPLSQVGPALKAIKRIGWQAFIEGVQEGGQEFLQNLIAREVYKPGQELGEGVVPAGALGSGVGAIAETGRLALESFGGGRRRARMAPPPPISDAEFVGTPPPGAETAQLPPPDTPLLPAPTVEPGEQPDQPTSTTRQDLADILEDDRPLSDILRERDEQKRAHRVQIIEEAGLPEVGRDVTITYPDGEIVQGTMDDVFEVEADGRTEAGVRVVNDQGAVEVFLNEAEISVTEGTGTKDDPIDVATAADVDVAATNVEPEPSAAQKEAENYRMGHITWQGLDVSIETAKGGTRTAADGSWSVEDFPAHYGRIKGTEGADRDHVDVYVGDAPESPTVFLVDQIDLDGKFDEHKAMVGFPDQQTAMTVYSEAFTDGTGPDRIGAFTPMPVEQFKAWVQGGDTKKPFAYEGPKVPEPVAPPVEPEPVAVEPATPLARLIGRAEAGEEVAVAELREGVKRQIKDALRPYVARGDSIKGFNLGFSIDGGNVHVGMSRAKSGQVVAAFGSFAEGKGVEIKFGLRKLWSEIEKEIQATETEAGAPDVQTVVEPPPEPPAAEAPPQPGATDAEEVTPEPVTQAEATQLYEETKRRLPKGYSLVQPVGEEGINLTGPDGFQEPVTPRWRGLTKADLSQAFDRAVDAARKRSDAAQEPQETPPEETGPTEPDEGPTATGEAETQPKSAPEADETETDQKQEPESEIEPESAEPSEDEGPTRGKKLQDAGEKMEGKRADIEKSFESERTDNIPKDVKRILDRASKAAAWTIQLPEGATPGTNLYLELVRSKFRGFLEHVGGKAGGGRRRWQSSFREAILKKVETLQDLQELEKAAAKYVAFFRQLKEITDGAMSIDQAAFALQRAFWKNDGAPETFTSGDLTDIGKAAEDYSGGYASWNLKRLTFPDGIRRRISDEDTRGARAKPLRRPRIESIERENLPDRRKGEDKDGQDLIDTFGFRGVEFGNWVNSRERQAAVNQAYDALYDLADFLGAPPKAISVGGTLGLAFGSRGHGRHAAHYEPGTVVINLTKTHGDGSLAHEWGHAFDYAMRRTSGSTDKSPAQLFAKFLATQYDKQSALNTLDHLLTQATYIVGQKSMGAIANAERFIHSLWRNKGWGPRRSTKFHREAVKLGKGYWAQPEELFARAFEAFVYDELGGTSPYLVNEWVEEGHITKGTGYKGAPYPLEDERREFNRAFRHLIENVDWSDDGPTIKDGYEDPNTVQMQAVKAALDEVGEDLEGRLAVLDSGEASDDGLWWYSYDKAPGRGAGRQPKGHSAFDDSAGDQGAVGYSEPLDADDITEFGLSKAKDFKSTGKTVYVKDAKDGGKAEDGGESDGADGVRPDGEEALGDPSAQDGGASQEDGGVPGSPVARPGDGEGQGGGSGVETGRGPGKREGRRSEGPDTASERDGGTGTRTRPDAVQPTGTNYRITDSDHIGQGNAAEKTRRNMEAIRLLREIENEGRFATPEEQRVLVRYVGWGGIPQVFTYASGQEWREPARELEKLLIPEEYAAARASTINAHYTSPEIIRAMYGAVRHLGSRGGRVIEPAAGVGHFYGVMPSDMSDASRVTMVEKDSISARITRQLYQRATVHGMAFEKTALPENFFDLVVSNVPFSNSDRPVDKRHNKERLNLHDYFIRKSVTMTRPGGLVAVISSKGTMDKRDGKARRLIAEKADLVAAVRLPQTAFEDNANTVVTTDILFLRRKVEGVPFEHAQAWENVVETELADENGEKGPAHVNEYFIANPEMMLGTMMIRHGRYGAGTETALIGTDEDLTAELEAALARLPADIIPDEITLDDQITAATAIPSPQDVKDGAFFEEEGGLWVKQGGEGIPFPENTNAAKGAGRIIRGLMGVRNEVRKVLRAQIEEASAAELTAARKGLNTAYDRFVKKHGFISNHRNARIFENDPDAALLVALEEWDADTEKATKADIFTKNTVKNRRPVEHVESVADALAVSLNERGRVDWPHITKLTGLSVDAAQSELRGVVYDDPEHGWVTSNAYLSGDVRHKLRVAKAAAESDGKFRENVEALEAVQPEDLPARVIHAQLGAPWIPSGDVQAFMAELIGGHVSTFEETVFIPETGKWLVARPARFRHNTSVVSEWGTSRANFYDLMGKALNGGFPKIFDTHSDGSKTVNLQDTEAAKAKLAKIKERFKEWLWEDADRAERLLRKYNDEYNNVVLRKYDGSHLSFPGMAEGMELTPHQVNGVWRILESGNTYVAHEVGTGKTFVLAAAAMEAKRLGIAKKPMIAVLNSTIEQFKAEFLRLYPGANVLSLKISENAAQRRHQMARIATNNWDAVIVTHESFSKLPVGESELRLAYAEELEALTFAMEAAAVESGGASTRLVKQIEKAKSSLENRLDALVDKVKKDQSMTFEETGVDMIEVDEAQKFKNLQFATSLGRQVRGLTPAGSGRAFDLYVKASYINRTYGRGVVLASGTPLSNSVGELFTISRFLQHQELKARGHQHFDTWAATFGDVGQTAEYLPEGGGYQMVTKFNRFVNVPELMQMVYSVMDPVTAEDAGIKRPKIKGGVPQAIVVPQNEAVADLQTSLKGRSQSIRSSPQAALPDNMLVVVSDGRKGAMDMRLVHPSAPDHEDTKTNHAVQRILERWKDSADRKGTQLVFADLGTPGRADKFSVYTDLKAKLVKRGIPADQIAFVHDANTDRKRMALFAKVRSGAIRVFLGSTEKAGTGVNVQERVVAIHHLDVHWNLANYKQRNGRGQRQGNINEEMEILNYATEGTVDAFMWDKVQAKGKIIDQFMSGDMTLREIDDISQETMSASEMVAFASGDPLISEKVQLESEVMALGFRNAAYADQHRRLKWQIQKAPGDIAALEEAIQTHSTDLASIDAATAIKIGMKTYKFDNAEQMAEANAKADKELKRIASAMKAESEAAQKVAAFGTLITEKGAGLSLYVRGSFMGPVMGARGVSGDHEWENPKIVRGLGTIQTSLKKGTESRSAEIERINQELPKLRAEAAKEFEQAEELETKSKRLHEIQEILLRKESEEAATVEAGAEGAEAESRPVGDYRFRAMGGDRAQAHSEFTIVRFDESDDEFFVARTGDQIYSVSHSATGLRVEGGATEQEAIDRARSKVANIGAEKFAEVISGATGLTDEQKQAAVATFEDERGPKRSIGSTFGRKARANREFRSKAREILQGLMDELDRLGLSDIRLKIARKVTVGVNGAEQVVDGFYEDGLVTVAVAGKKKMHQVLRHEAIHALREAGLFTKAEWETLVKAARASWRSEFNIDRRYQGESEEVKDEEAIAEAFGWFASDKATFGGRVLRAFNKILNFFKALGKALRGQGFTSINDIVAEAEEVLERVDAGVVGERENVSDAQPPLFDPLPEPVTAMRETFGPEATVSSLKAARADLETIVPHIPTAKKRRHYSIPDNPRGSGDITIEERRDIGDLDFFRRYIYTPQSWMKRWPGLAGLQKFGLRVEMDMSRFIRRLAGEYEAVKNKLDGEQFQKLSDVLFVGDAEEAVYTREDLTEAGVTDEAVIDAYMGMRELIEKIGRFVDQHRRSMVPQYRARKLAILRRMAHIRDMDDPVFRGLYNRRMRLRSRLRAGQGNPESLAEQIEAVERRLHILREETDEYQELARELDRIDAALAQTSIRRRTGYIPHKFFGTWAVYEIETNTTEDGEIEETHKLVAGKDGFFPDRETAIKGAAAFLRAHPDAELVVRPIQFTFPDSGATALTDASYWRFNKKVGDALEIRGQELRDTIKGVARRAFRRRIAGFTQHRQGVQGYSTDLDRVLRAHMAEAVRYVMLDKLKYKAISTMENMGLSPHRSANQKNKGLQDAVQAWFRDLNGQKQPFEAQIDEILARPWAKPVRTGLIAGGVIGGTTAIVGGSPLVAGLAGSYAGYRIYRALRDGGEFKTRALTGAMVGDMAHLKLGSFFNVVSAVVNLTQTVINTFPVLKGYTFTGMRLLEEAARTRLMRKPNRHWRLLERADIASQFKHTEAPSLMFKGEGTLAKASLFLFDTAEKFNRATAFLGGYQRAIDNGASEGEAFKAGERAMIRTQHHYGNASKPEILRNVLARVPGQFKNFVAQQITFVAGLDKKTELPFFLLSMFLVAGALGIPGLDLLDALFKWLFDFSPILEMKKAALRAQAKGEAIGAAANVLVRGLPTIIGEDLSFRAGMGDKFLPLEIRDLWGPWVSTVKSAVTLAELNATIADHVRNLSTGLGRPLKSLEAAANGLPLQDLFTDPKRFYEALADGKIAYTNPYKGGDLEYDETTLTNTDLARMAVGSTPMRVAQQRDVISAKNFETEKMARQTKRYMNQIVTAFRRYSDQPEQLDRVLGNIAEKATAAGVQLSGDQVNRALKNAFTPRLQRTIQQTRRQLRPEIFGLSEAITDDLRPDAGP